MTEIAIIFLLILINGVLSMSEIALISSRKSFLKNEADKGDKRAKTALKLFNDPDKFLSTVQIGITVIGILTGIYSGDILSGNFAAWLEKIGMPATYCHITAQSVIVIAVTYFTLIFGELVPKRIGMSVAEKVAITVAGMMNFLSILASPFVTLLSKSTSGVLSLAGIKYDSGKITEEEILSMIKEGRREGEVQQVEEDIMGRVFLLGDLKAESLMTHRKDIIFIEEDMTREEILPLIEKNEFEIFPVYSRDKDDILGVITIKSLAVEIQNRVIDINRIINPAIYIHENLDVYKALKMMREKRVSQLLVCDEFGSFRGIITLRDIMEGLVGTLDQNPNEQPIIKCQGRDGWLVDGQMPFYDFLSFFDMGQLFDNGIYNTVAGLILDKLEHIPQPGERLSWRCFEMEIHEMDGARIDKVTVLLSEGK
ncbi:MAG: hemolysin family protein [Bacteroidales bacterium]